MRDVAIIGAGITKFGERWDKSLRGLVAEAGLKAIMDAGLSGNEIEAGYVGTMASGSLIGQEHVGAVIADYMGLNPIPITRVEGACASGSLALRQGIMDVSSGMHNIVVVGGVEKMTDQGTMEVTDALGGAGDQEWELFQGMTFPGLYAMMAKRHMYEFGTSEEMLASVAVKNHRNGVKNPNAQYQREVTMEQVLNSKMVADPLKILDCSPITDGAAAVVLAPAEVAHKYSDEVVKIIASAQASDTIALNSRDSLTGLRSAQIAAREAYRQANLKPGDIQLAEVHDCFTIAEIMAIEDLGFFKKGEGGKASLEGRTDYGGDVVVNTSGGLKSAGHPIGATGIKQAVEINAQLRGKAGPRQLDDVEIGLSHNVGGTGATTVVHIYKRTR